MRWPLVRPCPGPAPAQPCSPRVAASLALRPQVCYQLSFSPVNSGPTYWPLPLAGLSLTHSAGGAALCGLMAVVLNRLAANGLLGLPDSLVPPPGSSGGDSSGGSSAGGTASAAPAAAAAAAGPAPKERFTVRLEAGGPQLDSVEGLLGALRRSGHSVEMRLSSNLTRWAQEGGRRLGRQAGRQRGRQACRFRYMRVRDRATGSDPPTRI